LLNYQTNHQNLTPSIEALRSIVAPPPDFTVSEWADSVRRLSPEASAEPGRWNTSRAEYQRGMMDAVSDPAVETVVVMSSAQIGKTEIINNIVGFHIDQDAAPLLLLQPTLEMAQAWSKDRLAPMLRDTKALEGKVKDARARDSGNTMLHKTFPGGHITMAGANSPASLASRPIRIVLCDEVDRYPVSAGTEGDPVNLAKKRSTTFWNRKLIMVSTPTVKGASRIEAAYEASDQRRYFVPCGDCDEWQILKWAQVQWNDDETDSAAYCCEHCGALWNDAKRWAAVREGEWRATAEFKGVAGFHLNEIYSPWVKMSDMAAAFLEMKKLPETLQTFINTSLGETWEDSGETVDGSGLMLRREAYDKNELPEGVVVLTAGVDVQDDRIEIELVGWGLDEESWSVDFTPIYGDLSAPAIWKELDEYLAQTFDHANGVKLRIASACIDSGGHYTQQVYSFVRGKAGRRVWAIKGMGGGISRPVMGKPTRNNIGKVPLYPVGVDAAKEMVYSRLKINQAGPGFCHFPQLPEYESEYFAQLTAEKIITKYVKGFPTRVWVKTRARNEALDCRVYAMAALAGLNANMAKLSANLKAETAEKIKTIAPEPENEVKTMKRPKRKAPRRGGGFAQGWK
jgi:phage terminase large subunit GpA-like protein